MQCLRCGNEMDIQIKGDAGEVIELDVCPECSGTWLDARELAKIDDNFFVNVEEIDYENVQPTTMDAELTCPRCWDTPVLRKVRPTVHPVVVLDTCPTCHGFWLDRGEMDKIRQLSDKLLIASLLPLDE
jgi:Zn-finger nucleic acid-binding protein